MNSVFRLVRLWAPLPVVVALLLPVRVLGAGAREAADAESEAKPAVSGEGIGPDYRLAPSDVVEVEMFNQSAVGTSQRLTAAGEVRLPLVGRVVLQGLTVREAEQLVEKLYRDGGFFKEPQVIISVNQYSSRTVAILGSVRSPDRIPLPAEANSIGILEAITLAGGLTRIAKADAVQVTRSGRDGTTETIMVDVRELLTARRPGEKLNEFQLLAGDVVFVPERAF